jgi:hypothetical protein
MNLNVLSDPVYRDFVEKIKKVHDVDKMASINHKRAVLMKNHEELVAMRLVIRGMSKAKNNEVVSNKEENLKEDDDKVIKMPIIINEDKNTSKENYCNARDIAKNILNSGMRRMSMS